jgi:hypothetical protein
VGQGLGSQGQRGIGGHARLAVTASQTGRFRGKERIFAASFYNDHPGYCALRRFFRKNRPPRPGSVLNIPTMARLFGKNMRSNFSRRSRSICPFSSPARKMKFAPRKNHSTRGTVIIAERGEKENFQPWSISNGFAKGSKSSSIANGAEKARPGGSS